MSPTNISSELILIAGPTASGKSSLAFALADEFAERSAYREKLELISVDSAQVYKGMDIGTAKATIDETRRYPIHLINIINPNESYSAGRFRTDALDKITEIQARGNRPILVGGTMLYYKVLLEGIHNLPSASKQVREDIKKNADNLGWAAMHKKLSLLDPETATSIKPADRQRISRALELIAEGHLPSKALKAQANSLDNPFPYRYRTIYLYPENRVRLREHIRKRWLAMWQTGLLDEVKAIQNKYTLTSDMPAMRSVGYRQICEYLASLNSASPMTIENLHERAVIATAQLAKRQITWLRKFIKQAQDNKTTSNTLVLDSSSLNARELFEHSKEWLFKV